MSADEQKNKPAQSSQTREVDNKPQPTKAEKPQPQPINSETKPEVKRDSRSNSRVGMIIVTLLVAVLLMIVAVGVYRGM